MARLAQKAAAAAAGATDGTVAHPPESTTPRGWQPGLVHRQPDDRGISELVRAGMPTEAACDAGFEQAGADNSAAGPEMKEAPKDALAGRGLIGGLKEDIEGLGARAAALSTFARRRSRELQVAAER